jgi:hypothetical protein
MAKLNRLKGIDILLAIVFAASLSGCGDSLKSQPVPPAAVKLSPAQEFEALTKKASGGDVDAQLSLALKYQNGDGVDKDLGKAVEWYEKAASAGNAVAQYRVGNALRYGNGIAEDVTKGMEWLQKAADQNYGDAQFDLWQMNRPVSAISKDDVESYVLLEKAASNGSMPAVMILGWRYESKDVVKAAEHYRKYAERGVSMAQLTLGGMYERGDGVPLSEETAFQWYLKSAQQGNSTAQFNLGSTFFKGELRPKDLMIASDWFKKSAAQGHRRAQNVLGLMYGVGDGLPEDQVLAYAWLNLAASGATGLQSAAKFRAGVETLLSKDELAEAQRLSTAWKTGQILVREGRASIGSNASASATGALTKQQTGSLFVVSKAGHAITNQHVIQGCTELRIEGREGVVKKVTDDAVNDLALVQMPGGVKATAAIATDPAKLRQGEDIVVFGFPLNALLSSGGNLTPGVVSAITGLGNNTNQIQITAPIQPGSSGSPVLNKKGQVVGVVSMKLDDKKMVRVTGQTGQNVNFAVSGQTLKTFLDTHKVDYRSGGGLLSFEKNTADLAEDARKWTLVVECWK